MDNAVLSQADIDSLLAGQNQAQVAARSEEEAPKPLRVIQLNAAGAGVSPGTGAPDTDSLKGLVAKLEERLGVVEATEKRSQDLGRELAEVKAAVSQLQQLLQALAAYSQKTAGQIEGVSTNLQGTPVYGLQKSFTCGHCQSKGNVAVRIRCTGCGQESWWGYWPPKK